MKADEQREKEKYCTPGAQGQIKRWTLLCTELQQETWRKDRKADRKQFVQGVKLEGEE